jgi:hypothetical protein
MQKNRDFLVKFFALIQNICGMLKTDLIWLKKSLKNLILVKLKKKTQKKTPKK